VLGQARDCAHERPGPRRQARALAEVASIALAGDWGPIRVKSGRVRCNGLCPLRANSGHSGKRGSCLRFREEGSRTRQDYPDFGELAGQSINLNRPAVLLDDDIVSDG